MTTPNYLATFRRAARTLGKHEINELNEISPTLSSFTSFSSYPPGSEPVPFAAALDTLERRLPEYIEPRRWHLCIDDAQRFLADWGDTAEALAWTADELFGLHTPPANPHPSYNRLSRYDCTGLIWHLTGNRVVALTADTAAIESRTTGNTLIYRKHNKPGLGPVGDSLDDFIA